MSIAAVLPYQTLGIEEAAAFLRMRPATLRKRAAAGTVPGYKPGKAWVLLLDELFQHLKASSKCPSISAKTVRTGGFGFSSTDAKSAAALAQRIAKKRLSLSRSSEAAHGDKTSEENVRRTCGLMLALAGCERRTRRRKSRTKKFSTGSMSNCSSSQYRTSRERLSR